MDCILLPSTVPSIWLLILIMRLPQLSETVYTPVFAGYCQALQTGESLHSSIPVAVSGVSYVRQCASGCFPGPSLGKAYSSIGTALAIFPALSPVIGGVIEEH